MFIGFHFVTCYLYVRRNNTYVATGDGESIKIFFSLTISPLQIKFSRNYQNVSKQSLKTFYVRTLSQVIRVTGQGIARYVLPAAKKTLCGVQDGAVPNVAAIGDGRPRALVSVLHRFAKRQVNRKYQLKLDYFRRKTT